MLALSISVPSQGTTINAAIADHVPVAELIPHLVTPEPGQHWVLGRAVGRIRPEHTLAEAGVRPGELLTLEIASTPAPPAEAVEELSGDVGASPAVWIMAVIAALYALRATPLWHPLAFHGGEQFGVATKESPADATAIIALAVATVAGFLAAGASLRDKRYSIVAAFLGLGVGLNVNVLVGCVMATLLVWRSGPVRIVSLTCLALAAVNFWPGLTLIIAAMGLAYAGQLAIVLARIRLPRVPATGVFQQPVETRAGNVIEVHSALVVGLCIAIAACVVQLAPWNSAPDKWTCALLVAVVVIGVSSRGTRPIHAIAVTSLSAATALWLALLVPWGFLVFALVAVPAWQVKSPMIGRIIDWVETLAFAVMVPLALHTTGLFAAIRQLGIGS
ncbi:EsaB/YukD family protein [uncultured Corynebacterium sp.]|uniref:EsaB/YukD family protein n=1 Tax=uncultured Corynebacterium sp. TaxID=159447 RepID=UPI0025F86E3D|nr:EsaB/YukD family protein [uncultured Corynebacterium sp.]